MSSARKARRGPEFEALDQRRLLSGGVAANLSRGVLSVVGTEAADVIHVEVIRNSTAGRARSRGVVEVVGVGRFAINRIKRIAINGRGGNDLVALNQPIRGALPSVILGGEGADLVLAGGNAQIDGGAGNDFINGLWDQPPTAVAPPVVPPPTATASLSEIERQVVEEANRARAAAGLAPLRVSTTLTAAAQLHARNMALLDRMAHILDGVAQPTLQSRAESVGYAFRWLGENIAYNYPDAAQVTTAWMNSQGHRDNLLNPNFTEIGVGVVRNARGELYYCQTFGQPS